MIRLEREEALRRREELKRKQELDKLRLSGGSSPLNRSPRQEDQKIVE